MTSEVELFHRDVSLDGNISEPVKKIHLFTTSQDGLTNFTAVQNYPVKWVCEVDTSNTPLYRTSVNIDLIHKCPVKLVMKDRTQEKSHSYTRKKYPKNE